MSKEFKHTLETKMKISDAKRGQKHSEATKGKIATALIGNQNGKGYRHTKEAKQKISNAMKGHSGAWLGKHFSKEHKEKLSVANTGKNHYNYGRRQSNDTKCKIRNSMLKLKDFKGNKGSVRHQRFVAKISQQLKGRGHSVEVEKAVKLGQNHWRIIDILVDQDICYELGACDKDKIKELKEHGFSVIHLTYNTLEEI